MREAMNSSSAFNYLGAMGTAVKFCANVAFNVVNDATTLITGLTEGVSNAHDAEGVGKNPQEYTDAGMSTILNFTPLPDKYLNVSPVKLTAPEFSVLNKGTEVLSKPKSEVGTLIKQANNATIEAASALNQSSNVVTATTGAGNVKQEIERKK